MMIPIGAAEAASITVTDKIYIVNNNQFEQNCFKSENVMIKTLTRLFTCKT